jgi:hypothetical protein
MQHSRTAQALETRGKRWGRTALALLIATAIWLPSLSGVFAPKAEDLGRAPGISSRARRMAERQLRLWANDDSLRRQLDQMRASNAEWDFMGRTFLVLALCNMAP